MPSMLEQMTQAVFPGGGGIAQASGRIFAHIVLMSGFGDVVEFFFYRGLCGVAKIDEQAVFVFDNLGADVII